MMFKVRETKIKKVGEEGTDENTTGNEALSAAEKARAALAAHDAEKTKAKSDAARLRRREERARYAKERESSWGSCSC